eukprot:6174087-Pleurochrysis_carterae.AAC.1
MPWSVAISIGVASGVLVLAAVAVLGALLELYATPAANAASRLVHRALGMLCTPRVSVALVRSADAWKARLLLCAALQLLDQARGLTHPPVRPVQTQHNKPPRC